MTKDIWVLNSALRSFLDEFHRHVDQSHLRVADSVPVEPVSRDKVESAIAGLRRISEATFSIFTRCKALGLTNHKLMSAALYSMHQRADEILDIAESAQLALQPEVFNPIFDSAAEEYRRGEVFTLG